MVTGDYHGTGPSDFTALGIKFVGIICRMREMGRVRRTCGKILIARPMIRERHCSARTRTSHQQFIISKVY